jgi:hypothetical protein
VGSSSAAALVVVFSAPLSAQAPATMARASSKIINADGWSRRRASCVLPVTYLSSLLVYPKYLAKGASAEKPPPSVPIASFLAAILCIQGNAVKRSQFIEKFSTTGPKTGPIA